MNFVYAIICHKFTEPLLFTVKTLLQSPRSRIVLHIDAKTSNDDVVKIQSALGEHKHLYYIPKSQSIDVRWGSVSQIEVMLLLLRSAQCYDYQYFSLISGDDIPLSSNASREQFFKQAYLKQTEFMGYNSIHNATQRLEIKYLPFLYQKDHSILGKMRRKFFLMYAQFFRKQDISHLPELYKGSTWFSLTGEAVSYILNYIDQHPTYFKAFEHSLCGDEVFFQTILFNSPFRSYIYGIDDNLPDCEMGARYIDWVSGPSYPRELNQTDFEKMKRSGLLFARKMKPELPSELFRSLIE